jgi:hypothetical protein
VSHPLKFAEGGAASVDLIEGWASPQKNGAAPKGLRHPVFSLYIQEYGDKQYGDKEYGDRLVECTPKLRQR